MAKKWNDIYKDSLEQVYSRSVNALILAAKQVPGVDFSPVLAPNGKVDATTSKYTVQRLKRPTVNTVVDPNSGTTKASLDALDQMSDPDWESLEIATGALRSVGFKETFNDDFDFSNSPIHSRLMTAKVEEVAVQRHKDIIALLQTAKPTGTALPAYAEGKTDVWNAIADEVIKLAAIDDAFKDVQGLTDFYIVTSNIVAKELAQEMGKAFQNEAPIAQTGFKTNMSINGTPVIVDARLTGRETFVAHNEAIAFGKQEIKDVNVDLGLTQYTGSYFYDIAAIIDAARVAKFGTTKK